MLGWALPSRGDKAVKQLERATLNRLRMGDDLLKINEAPPAEAVAGLNSNEERGAMDVDEARANEEEEEEEEDENAEEEHPIEAESEDEEGDDHPDQV